MTRRKLLQKGCEMVKRMLFALSLVGPVLGICSACGSNSSIGKLSGYQPSEVTNHESSDANFTNRAEVEWDCAADNALTKVELKVWSSYGSNHDAIEEREESYEVHNPRQVALTFNGTKMTKRSIEAHTSLRLVNSKMIMRYVGEHFVMELELPKESNVLNAGGELAVSTGDAVYTFSNLKCRSPSRDGFVYRP